MPGRDEPAREPLLKRLFFGGSGHTEREENVLRYVIHRVNHDAPLQDVIHEDYVRRNCSRAEIERIVNDPELVHAAREHLWRAFRSSELDPSRARRSSAPSTNCGPADARDDSSSTSPGA